MNEKNPRSTSDRPPRRAVSSAQAESTFDASLVAASGAGTFKVPHAGNGGSHGSPPLDSITDPLVALDRTGRYLYVNPAAERLKGRAAADLIGCHIGEVYPEAMTARIMGAYRRVVQNGVHETLEEYFAPSDVWYEIHAYPSSEGLWIWFRDVTERKRRAQAVAESNSYRALFERSPVALYRTAPDGRLLDANDALLRLLGYPDRETFLRVNAEEVYVNPRDRRRWQALIEKQDEVSFEMRDRRYDGTVIWVRDVARAVRDDRGAIVCYEGMLEDITARTEAGPSRFEDEDRFRLLALTSDDVIWDWNVATGRVRWNEALRRVFGHPPEYVGPTIEQSYAWWIGHIHPEDRDRVAAGLHHAVESGALEFGAEYRFRRLDGAYVPVLDRGCIERDETGGAVRMIGSIIDLAHRSRAPDPPSPRCAVEPPVPPTPDATLVEWIARGDERAFDALYVRHAQSLFALASSILRSHDDACEVVADSFLRAWHDAARFDADRGTVTAWLATLCRSRAGEQRRKKRRRSRILDEALEQPGPVRPALLRTDSPPEAEALPDRLTVENSLARLPDGQRHVVELSFFAGLSHAEIAERLNQPLGTVKTRIRAGLDRMREHVREE